jgi:hypothetical protein
MATDSNGVILGATPAGVPHLAIPFAIAYDGSAQVVEQDTSEDIVQCVAMLVGSRPGDRLLVPGYGTPDPTFTGLQVGPVRRSASRWEPRATLSVQVDPGGTERVVVGVAGGN